MNTKKHTKRDKTENVDQVIEILAQEETALIKSNKILQEKLNAEKDGRKEDSFLWVFGFIIVLDIVH